jgi:tetratricopeptide (TPR) repeat protein
MKDSEQGRQIHAQAVEALEKEQNFLKALQLTDEATLAYQKDGDVFGLGEVQGSRVNTFKHLHRQTGDRNFLILAKHSAMAAVEIAEGAGDPGAVAIPNRDLGKVFIELEQYDQAVGPLQRSLQIMRESPSLRFDWDAVRAEIQAHLGFAQYMAGNKEHGRANMMEAIELLSREQRSYEVDVWLSGAYMRGAVMMHIDDPGTSKQFLSKAKEIIDTNPELTLRKEELEKLSARLAS